MPTAATAQDVSDLLGRSLTTDETERVDRLIVRAEGLIAGDMPGLTFGAVTARTDTLEGDGDEFLVLPLYPVTAVTSVAVEGNTLDPTEYAVDTLGRLRRLYSSLGSPQDAEGTRGRWPDAGVTIVVTYDAGFTASTVPSVIGSVAAELVAARMTNPEQVTQESIGDRSHSFARAAGAGDDLTDGQRNRLRHWRRNRFASARMRL